jgi:hypothetical protein
MPITIKFVDAKGQPFKGDDENIPAVEISYPSLPDKWLLQDNERKGYIELPGNYQHVRGDVPLVATGFTTKTFSPYPREEISANPGDTITIKYLREGEEPENVPVSLFGGLLIGTAVAAGAFALIHYVIKPKGIL